MVLYSAEFTSNDRNPNANGNGRSILVTQDCKNGPVRIVISGLQGTGLNTRPVTLSDATIPEALWLTHRHALTTPGVDRA